MVAKLNGAPRLTSLDHRSSSSGDQSVLRWSVGFLRRVVDLGRARVDYAEQGLEKKQKKKKKSVAGVEQEELVDETSLGDPDSLFLDLNGVQIHHKLCCSELQYRQVVVKFPFLLLHGFGASAFSWNLAMEPLSRLTSSKVLAFDRPAFGLTSREAPVHAAGALSPYSTAFSVRSTVSFVDSLGAEKAIVVGHSAGSIVAVNTYFEAPERVAALILVCPALAAPLISLTLNQNNNNNNNQKITIESETTCVPITGGDDDDDDDAAAFVGFRKFLSNLCTSSFAVMLLRFVLDVFGLSIVRHGWFDETKFTDCFIRGYTKPLKAKGWEKALLEFVVAMVTDPKPFPKRSLSEIKCPDVDIVDITTVDVEHIPLDPYCIEKNR
ncbi:hypothetical protein QJS04_geneDACA016964 [Acorus gramineus]|uniref:AB hydrolase-1 domain-containing protein n=1 Tax=Acorus gramineus TaxID=55184 RepID=A0AAV9AKB1_ACOGR|nr:hypothetical protein QJS04_geneDACA016964 [Acorus gramineus]